MSKTTEIKIYNYIINKPKGFIFIFKEVSAESGVCLLSVSNYFKNCVKYGYMFPFTEKKVYGYLKVVEIAGRKRYKRV